jgi:hypothetical protein
MLKVTIIPMLLITVAAHAATEHQTPYFKVVNDGNTAQVFPLKAGLPAKIWNKACRKALSYPLRVNKQRQLSKELDLPLPDTINYATSELTEYKEQKIEGGLTCNANIEETKTDLGRARLALMNAWWAIEQNKKGFLQPLLRISMSNPLTKDDSMVVIASQTSIQKGHKILTEQVNSNNLLLNESKASMAKFWLEQGNHKQASNILTQCDSQLCYQLQYKANIQKELYDEKTANNLSSYF